MENYKGPSPAELGIVPDRINQEAPKTDAEAKKNQEHFQTMNQLFMADRDGKNIPEMLASNPELAKSVKEVLDSKVYNPEGLKLEQIQGQFVRESTPGEKGTENKWKNMVTLADGRTVANPFAVAAGLGREGKQMLENQEGGKKPETGGKPSPEAGGGDNGEDKAKAEKLKADREERAKKDDEAAKVAVNQIVDQWMKTNPDDVVTNLSEGGKQEGFKRAQRTVTEGGSSTTSFRAELPGQDVGQKGYQVGGSDIQPLPAEAQPSFADRIKGGLKKIFGGGEKTPVSTSGQEVPTMSKEDADRLTDVWMANNPENVPDQNLSAGGKQEGFERVQRTVTEGGSSTTSSRVELPGRKLENQPGSTQETQKEEERKAA